MCVHAEERGGKGGKQSRNKVTCHSRTHVTPLKSCNTFSKSLLLSAGGQGGKQSPPGGVGGGGTGGGCSGGNAGGMSNSGSPLSALEMTRLALFKMYNQAGLPPPPPLRDPPQSPHPAAAAAAAAAAAGHLDHVGRAVAEQQARALQAVREAEAAGRAVAAAAAAAAADKVAEDEKRPIQPPTQPRKKRLENDEDDEDERNEEGSSPPVKRERHDSLDGKSNGSPVGGGGANIRISSRGTYCT